MFSGSLRDYDKAGGSEHLLTLPGELKSVAGGRIVSFPPLRALRSPLVDGPEEFARYL